MQLQRIEFPTEHEKNRKNMYLRGQDGEVAVRDGTILSFFKQGKVTFDTYFNALSIEKWLRYTRLESLWFAFHAKGCLSVRVWNAYIGNQNTVEMSVLAEEQVKSAQTDKIRIEIPISSGLKGIIFVEAEALEAGSIFSDASYGTDTVPKNHVSLLLNICTYKREKYLKHNLEVLSGELVDNPESLLYRNLDVFVVDNGKTIPENANPDWLTVFPNKNAGGTAGFTRGMIEALRSSKPYTHILLMDDDVEIKTSALEKNYAFLSLMKEQYAGSMIGGAMLRNDYSFIQKEAGGSYAGGKVESLHGGIDLREAKEVIANEIREHYDYNAWWYCCIPIETIKKNGLPLPLFIHEDDVEYGLRCKEELILLNGICVWHDTFEHKRPSVNEYYDVRNSLIVNSLYCKEFSKRQALKMVYRRMLTNLFRYRYKDIVLVIRALKDFLRGPKWLMEQDAEELHQELMASGYKYSEPYAEQLPHKDAVRLEDILAGKTNAGRIDKKKILTLNGWLLPALGSKKPLPLAAGESPHAYFRRRAVWIYDPDTEKGFYTGKELGRLPGTVIQMISCCVLVQHGFTAAKEAYGKHLKDMCSEAFWIQYLKLKEKTDE